MQAYATSERLPLGDQFRTLDRMSASTAAAAGQSDRALIDQFLGHLADLVVDRLMKRADAQNNDQAIAWLDARGAAEYLASIATRCASSPHSAPFRPTRTDLAASCTSAAMSSTSGGARLVRWVQAPR